MKMTESGSWIGKSLLLIWAVLCILLFIGLPGKVSYVQWSNLSEWQLLPAKLERLHPIQDSANFLGSFLGVVVFSVACTSLGIFVRMQGNFDDLSNSRTVLSHIALFATDFLIGHGLFSLIFLTVAGLYQLTPIYVILILCSGFILGAGSLKNAISKAFLDVKSSHNGKREEKSDQIIIWLSLSILCFSLLYSTARISYDSSSIYFSNAKLTAMTHQVQYFVDDTFVASVFHTAIQFTALIQIFGDQSARMFSWVCGIIVIIFSLALGERVGISRKAKIILLVFLLTSTAFLDLMGDGKVDIMSSAPAIAAVYWMVVEGQNKKFSISILVLTGFLIGLAILARPFNAFLLGIFVILFYLQRIYIKGGFEPLSYKSFVSSMTWIAIGALGLGVYHLFANWIILGSPLAFLSSVSRINPSGGPWDYDPDQFLAIRLLYPIVGTFYNSPQTLGNISPLFVAFLPSFFIQRIRTETRFSKQLIILLSIAILTLLVWIFSLFTVFEIRYVLFLWSILFIPLAEIIAKMLEKKEQVMQYVLSTLLITLLAFTLIRTIYISLDKYSPIDQHGNPQCFCDSIDPINTVAAPGDRVLTLNAFRYYLRADLFACSTKHDEYSKLNTASLKSSDAFWLEVYRQGYEYLSYEHEYTTRHLQMGLIPRPDNTPEWLELEPIYSGPDNLHAAYRIKIKNPPNDSTAICEMNASGIWEVRSTK